MNKEIAKKNAELLLWMAENPGINKCKANGDEYIVKSMTLGGLLFKTTQGHWRASEELWNFLVGARRFEKYVEPKPITWQEAIERILDGKPVTRKTNGPIKFIDCAVRDYIGIPKGTKEIEWLIPPE